MFASLPEHFRSYGVASDLRTLLLFQKAIQKGLIRTLGDIYTVLKSILVKDVSDLGPYTAAYYKYFLNIAIDHGESLHDAILRSETFRQWKTDNLDRFGDDRDLDALVDRFLEEVHTTTYDIKEVLDGKALWNKDNPELEDETLDIDAGDAERKALEQLADYSDLSLDELMERMQKVWEQQRGKHSGGSHWIGTGGISPYGHGGAAKDGIRVGGTGGGKMARRILSDRKFFPVDTDAILNDNNVDAALAALKGVQQETSEETLDIPQTIDKGIKRGGLFIPEMEFGTSKKLQVLLLIDNGGYSMDPYVKIVRTLFRKMQTRFAHDLETFYFHNTIYDKVYSDSQRRKSISIDSLLSKNPDYRVFIIGDASMASYELSRTSIASYKALTTHFKHCSWLNPEPMKYWHYTFTIQVIKELVPMYPLSPKGIEEAVRQMNRII